MEQNVTVVLEAGDVLAGAQAACGVGVQGGSEGLCSLGAASLRNSGPLWDT